MLLKISLYCTVLFMLVDFFQCSPGSGVVTAALCAMLKEGGHGALQPLYMAAEINRKAAGACKRTAEANRVIFFAVDSWGRCPHQLRRSLC